MKSQYGYVKIEKDNVTLFITGIPTKNITDRVYNEMFKKAYIVEGHRVRVKYTHLHQKSFLMVI